MKILDHGSEAHVNFLTSIDYLVWSDTDSSPVRYTSKVQKVEDWKEKGSNIPIVTDLSLLKR